MNKKIVQLISLTFLQAMFASSSLAKEVYDWSITTYAGMHHPNIETLSEGLYNSPMVGKAPALEDVDGSAALVEFRIDAPLVEVGNAAKAGAEFQWKPGKRHSFIFGASGLEKTSITRLDTKFPIQGVVRPTTLERRGKLSYTEYYLGWRYGLFESKKLRMYSRLVVHEIFDVDYREDFSFLFPYWDVGDPDKSESFTRVVIMEAQTTGLLFGEIGFGAEYFLDEWVSVGMELGIFVGESRNKLDNVSQRSSFQEQDNIDNTTTSFPFGETKDGVLGYLQHNANSTDVNNKDRYSPVNLNFNGWQALLRLSFYY